MSVAGIDADRREACHDWPSGNCKRGDDCTREHHPNLDPALASGPEYRVPNETGVACQRCMQRMYPCDKKGRGGQDDPCSECRWFGGENCRCLLLQDTSYNDQIWSVMIKRGARFNYTLPADKPRTEGNPKNPPPAPMPASKVMAGWQGETREALLNKGDILPSGVRECPRAYLVAPRPSAAAKKSQAWRQASSVKSEQSFGANFAASSFAPTMSPAPGASPFAPPAFPAPPPSPFASAPFFAPPASYPPPVFARPPPDPRHGSVLSSSYDWDRMQYTHTYQSGATTTDPATTPSSNKRPRYE